MENRVKTIEASKTYAQAFNRRNLVRLGQMLDEEKIIFSRQTQSTIVGKENVIRRIRNLFWRLDQQNHGLKLINAIADVGETMARPCLIGLLNGKRVALCLLSCKFNGKITSIVILTRKNVVASARATEDENAD